MTEGMALKEGTTVKQMAAISTAKATTWHRNMS